MREIKFRAWDIKNKKWLKDWSSYKAGGSEQYFVGFNGDLGRHRTIVGLPMPIFEFDDDPDSIIIEQYTGLKDKNGKEIYEGDIIQEEIDFNSKMTDGTFKYRVYWDEEELCWCLEHIGNESIHHELWQCNESTGVIGNIHENPELLGKDKQ